MTTSEGSYSVLEKKLDELEALLKDHQSHTTLETLPAEIIHSQVDREEALARLGFLKVVISSEMKLNAGVPPKRLQNMAEKLQELADAYQNRIGPLALSVDNPDHDNRSCSCASSCLNEEDAEGDLIVADVLTAVDSNMDNDGGKNYQEKEVEAIEESIMTHMNDSSLHERDEELQEKESKNTEEPTAPLEKSKSRSNDDIQMILQGDSGLQNAEGFGSQGTKMKSVKKCGFIGRTLVAAAGAVLAIAATRFWHEEEVYLVPT